MKTVIQLVLLVVILALGWYVYDSIMEPVQFKKEMKAREAKVVQHLKDIRNVQYFYKNANKKFTGSFDSLEQFIQTGEIPVIKIIPDPEDTTFVRTISDTVGFVSIMDSLFGKRPDFKVGNLGIIPFSGGEFFKLNAGTIDRGGVEVGVFEAKAHYNTFLKGMDEQAIINLIASKEDIDRYPGLKVGSMTEPSTDGNWE
ncbi:MAG: hypothetical protein C0598_04340 [Marinilabiliales bacterium]|nr:MAG: hypothetical protein C0598_04340 [Marinilabiliales bacterium]